MNGSSLKKTRYSMSVELIKKYVYINNNVGVMVERILWLLYFYLNKSKNDCLTIKTNIKHAR